MARKLSLVYTLALLVTLCTISLPSVEANNLSNHARMIRKRSPSPSPNLVKEISNSPDIPVIGAGADPNQPTDTSGAGASPTDSKSAVLPSGTGAATSSTSTNPFSIGLSIPGVGSATSSASSALSSASSSANSTSSTLSSTSSTTTSATPLSTVASTSGTQVVFSTVLASASTQQAAASATNTDVSSASSSSSLGKNTIIAIAVIGACIGGAVVIWTVIRKWKFAPSDEFGDRLNPIDWRPTSATDKDVTEKFGEGRDGAGHRRTGSRGSNRSFVSADAHSMRNTPTPAPGNMIPDLPAHDFTAGAAPGVYGNGGLAPVGAYADLRRGPSPAPSMNNGDGYYRGYGATQFGQNGY